jgi:hypothetical protein
MTIDKLLAKSADELEKMTDEELNAYFKPYLIAVREPVTERKSNSKLTAETKSYSKSYENKKKEEKLAEIARQLNIKL